MVVVLLGLLLKPCKNWATCS